MNKTETCINSTRRSTPVQFARDSNLRPPSCISLEWSQVRIPRNPIYLLTVEGTCVCFYYGTIYNQYVFTNYFFFLRMHRFFQWPDVIAITVQTLSVNLNSFRDHTQNFFVACWWYSYMQQWTQLCKSHFSLYESTAKEYVNKGTSRVHCDCYWKCWWPIVIMLCFLAC